MKKLILAIALSLTALPYSAFALDENLVAQSEVQATLAHDDIKDIRSCDDRHIKAALSTVTELESTLESQYSASIDPQRSHVERVYRSQTIDYLIPTALNLKLDLADKLKDTHCYNQAKPMYMDVMKTYVGSRYEAYRERAELGITGMR